MVPNLTRFYFNEFPAPNEEGMVFVDLETIEADSYEAFLKQDGIDYTRIDL